MVKNPTTTEVMAMTTNILIPTPSGILTADSDFVNFLIAQKQATDAITTAWSVIQAQMLEHNVKSLKGDWGSISVAERKNWKATTTLPDEFYKPTLNTTRLNAMFKLNDTFPNGVEMTSTTYLARRLTV